MPQTGTPVSAPSRMTATFSLLEQILVPGQALEVHELSATGVGYIGDVDSSRWTARELPDEECVNRSEEQISRSRALPYTGDILENPNNFQAAEIGAERQTGLKP